jgi:hypothetical protein
MLRTLLPGPAPLSAKAAETNPEEVTAHAVGQSNFYSSIEMQDR